MTEALNLQSPVVAVDETGRRDHDAYFTPEPLAAYLVQRLVSDGFWRGGTVVEPSAGRGSFVRAITMTTPCPSKVFAVDVDRVRCDELQALPIEATGGIMVLPTCCDFSDFGGSYDLILGNPPYNLAETHARHALSLRSRFGAVAFLLRLAFFESKERIDFWDEHPASKVYVLSERPSFTGGKTDNSAYGFFVWANWHRGPTELEVISWKSSRPPMVDPGKQFPPKAWKKLEAPPEEQSDGGPTA